MAKSHGNAPEGISELRDNVPDGCQTDDSCRTGSFGALFTEEGARCNKRPWPEMPPAQLDALTEVSGRMMADERPAGTNPTDPEEQEKFTKRRRVAGENLAAVAGRIFVEEPNYPLTFSRKSDCPVEPSGCGLVHLAEVPKQREVEGERLHGVQGERSHGVQRERSHGVQGERSHGVQRERSHGVQGERSHGVQGEQVQGGQGKPSHEAQGNHVHGGQRVHLHEQCEAVGKSAEGGEEQPREKWMRVLAVDDSPTDRRLVERLLQQRHYEVTTAESGVHALGVLGLDQMKAEASVTGEASKKVAPNFDLIMTDYSMPGLTGYQLLQRLKKEETGLENVPVVIMSSDNFPKRVAKCMEGGAEEYLQKPVQAADISRIDAQLLKRKGSGETRAKSPSTERTGGSDPTSGA